MPRFTRCLSLLTLGVGLAWSSLPAYGQKNSDIENIGKRDINKGSWNLYSLEREIKLGRRLARDVERSSRLLTDREVNAYLRDLTQRLVRNSDARVPFVVRVIDSDEVNAVALPGGYLYVNTGLILAAQSEAELAGILAHEIAHVTARHAVERATKARVVNWLSLPLIFIGGSAAYTAYQILGIAGPLMFLKFSRGAEREADFLGLQYSYKTGYDPAAMIDFLERIKQREKSKVPGIFSTHPMTQDRIRRAEKTIAGLLPSRPEYVVTTSAFEQVQAYLLELTGWESIYEVGETSGPVLRRRTETKTNY
ncbi:MAG: M48 family metallopeptidase [Terriglobia bacterium]